MKKQELRKLYKQKRKALTNEELTSLQENLYAKIFQLDYSNYQNIHIFLPIEKQKEINTYPIIDFFRKLNKTIIISKSDFMDNTLKHYIFKEDTILKLNQYNIPEPENAEEINVKEIDLVFVPMLISDQEHYRVGYGKGFYDKFLSDCKEDIKTIGLNYFKPIEKISDTNVYDVPLDIVLFGA